MECFWKKKQKHKQRKHARRGLWGENMLNPWIASQKLNWSSDWNGDEVGYDDIAVVGLYSVQDMDIDVYIDMETMQILDIFCLKDHEEE
jgi:hypothetical protein